MTDGDVWILVSLALGVGAVLWLRATGPGPPTAATGPSPGRVARHVEAHHALQEEIERTREAVERDRREADEEAARDAAEIAAMVARIREQTARLTALARERRRRLKADRLRAGYPIRVKADSGPTTRRARLAVFGSETGRYLYLAATGRAAGNPEDARLMLSDWLRENGHDAAADRVLRWQRRPGKKHY